MHIQAGQCGNQIGAKVSLSCPSSALPPSPPLCRAQFEVFVSRFSTPSFLFLLLFSLPLLPALPPAQAKMEDG